MKRKITRRTGLKLMTAGTLTSLGTRGVARAASPGKAKTTPDPWSRTHDRIWLGGEFWANPMEDWRVRAVRSASATEAAAACIR
jgi:hypothetical protein